MRFFRDSRTVHSRADNKVTQAYPCMPRKRLCVGFLFLHAEIIQIETDTQDMHEMVLHLMCEFEKMYGVHMCESFCLSFGCEIWCDGLV